MNQTSKGMNNIAIVSPGAGRIHGRVLLKHAWKNMRLFRREVASQARIVRETGHDSEGRYVFVLVLDNRVVSVCMPCLPWPGGDQHDWYRLYVEGNSWFWCYAVEIARECLAGSSST